MKIKGSLIEQSEKPVRHILALSGGKDSSALAVHMRGKIPNMEYVFCDTGEELEETYEYISKLQDYLCKKVEILRSGRDFKHYVDLFRGVLPDARTRWCTRLLKLKPYEDFIGNDLVISYVGIRADELHRTGYISTKTNIKTLFPFRDDNIRRDDVLRILKEAGLGLPRYYDWRSRSGCFFCFFQQKREWVGLLENHPVLFEKAKAYEKFDALNGEKYTWCKDESLEELSQPERIVQIKKEYEKRKTRKDCAFKGHQKLIDVWDDVEKDDEFEELSCTLCHL
jgi:3'-phosphoadenosine 5'-phosphosulfate sulfotransferase (PAPS reductase)/FAD synthetase